MNESILSVMQIINLQLPIKQFTINNPQGSVKIKVCA